MVRVTEHRLTQPDILISEERSRQEKADLSCHLLYAIAGTRFTRHALSSPHRKITSSGERRAEIAVRRVPAGFQS